MSRESIWPLGDNKNGHPARGSRSTRVAYQVHISNITSTVRKSDSDGDVKEGHRQLHVTFLL